jgi:hypothetical protein
MYILFIDPILYTLQLNPRPNRNSTHCPVAGNLCCVIVDPTAFNAEFESCVMLGKILGFLFPSVSFLSNLDLLTSHSEL